MFQAETKFFRMAQRREEAAQTPPMGTTFNRAGATGREAARLPGIRDRRPGEALDSAGKRAQGPPVLFLIPRLAP